MAGAMGVALVYVQMCLLLTLHSSARKAGFLVAWLPGGVGTITVFWLGLSLVLADVNGGDMAEDAGV